MRAGGEGGGRTGPDRADPRVGARDANRLEAARAQPTGGGLGELLVRRDHHSLVGDARAPLEGGGSRQSLAGEHVALPVGGDTTQLGAEMIVAVNAER